jgi:hypothetical protein
VRWNYIQCVPPGNVVDRPVVIKRADIHIMTSADCHRRAEYEKLRPRHQKYILLPVISRLPGLSRAQQVGSQFLDQSDAASFEQLGG